MEILIWLLVTLLTLVPKKVSSSDAGFDKVRSVALLLCLIYLMSQV